MTVWLVAVLVVFAVMAGLMVGVALAVCVLTRQAKEARDSAVAARTDVQEAVDRIVRSAETAAVMLGETGDGTEDVDVPAERSE